MDRDRQIEEMLNEICVNCNYLLVCEDEHLKQVCRYAKVVKVLYNAGYRKQSDGEWVKKDRAGVSIKGFMVCSECNVMLPACEDNWYCLSRLRYCPNCGAKMKGGAE